MDDSLSLIVFSGTDDKLEAVSVLSAGGAAMGRKVNIFLQYWGLDAFRKDALLKDHGVSAEAGPEGAEIVRRAREKGSHWSEVLGQAKEIGEVSITACALSMDHFGLSKDDLDPIVDGVQGVASFMANATGAIVFI
jgi:peroxiredoxin family protein